MTKETVLLEAINARLTSSPCSAETRGEGELTTDLDCHVCGVQSGEPCKQVNASVLPDGIAAGDVRRLPHPQRLGDLRRVAIPFGTGSTPGTVAAPVPGETRGRGDVAPVAVEPEPREQREVWRTGRKLGRTLYAGERFVGIMDSPTLAALVVATMNAASTPAPEVKREVVREKGAPWSFRLSALIERCPGLSAWRPDIAAVLAIVHATAASDGRKAGISAALRRVRESKPLRAPEDDNEWGQGWRACFAQTEAHVAVLATRPAPSSPTVATEVQRYAAVENAGPPGSLHDAEGCDQRGCPWHGVSAPHVEGKEGY